MKSLDIDCFIMGKTWTRIKEYIDSHSGGYETATSDEVLNIWNNVN